MTNKLESADDPVCVVAGILGAQTGAKMNKLMHRGNGVTMTLFIECDDKKTLALLLDRIKKSQNVVDVII